MSRHRSYNKIMIIAQYTNILSEKILRSKHYRHQAYNKIMIIALYTNTLSEKILRSKRYRSREKFRVFSSVRKMEFVKNLVGKNGEIQGLMYQVKCLVNEKKKKKVISKILWRR